MKTTTPTTHLSRIICGVIMSIGMAIPAQEAKPATGRAVAGQNFTNSAGMEMIWINEGGFWIGRSEVTKDAYKVIMGEGGAGSMPADGISLIKALMFCDALTTQETSTAKGKRIRPSGAQYTLPGVKQWQLARGQAEALGLTGFSDDLSEWTKDQMKSGLTNTNTVAFATPDPKWFIICRGSTVEALPPQSTGNITRTGAGQRASGTAGTVTMWSGRLSFRVILVPQQ